MEAAAVSPAQPTFPPVSSSPLSSLCTGQAGHPWPQQQKDFPLLPVTCLPRSPLPALPFPHSLPVCTALTHPSGPRSNVTPSLTTTSHQKLATGVSLNSKHLTCVSDIYCLFLYDCVRQYHVPPINCKQQIGLALHFCTASTSVPGMWQVLGNCLFVKE